MRARGRGQGHAREHGPLSTDDHRPSIVHDSLQGRAAGARTVRAMDRTSDRLRRHPAHGDPVNGARDRLPDAARPARR